MEGGGGGACAHTNGEMEYVQIREYPLSMNST